MAGGRKKQTDKDKTGKKGLIFPFPIFFSFFSSTTVKRRSIFYKFHFTPLPGPPYMVSRTAHTEETAAKISVTTTLTFRPNLQRKITIKCYILECKDPRVQAPMCKNTRKVLVFEASQLCRRGSPVCTDATCDKGPPTTTASLVYVLRTC